MPIIGSGSKLGAVNVYKSTQPVEKPSAATAVKDFFGIGKPGLGTAGKVGGMIAQTPLWLGKAVLNTAGNAAKSIGLGVIPESFKNLKKEGILSPTAVFNKSGREEMLRRSTDVLEAAKPKWAKSLGENIVEKETLGAYKAETEYSTIDAITDVMDLSILLPGGSILSKATDPISWGLSAAGKQVAKSGLYKSAAATFAPLTKSLKGKFNVWNSESIMGKTGQKLKEVIYKNKDLRRENISKSINATSKLFRQVRVESEEQGLRRVQMALDNIVHFKKLQTPAEKELFVTLKSILDDTGKRMVGLGIIPEEKLVSMYNPRKVVLPFKYVDEMGKEITEYIDMGDVLKSGTKAAKGFENLMKRTQPELADLFAKGLDVGDDYERTFVRYITATENIINRERTFKEAIAEFGEKATGKLFGARKSKITAQKVAQEGVVPVSMGNERYYVSKKVYEDMENFLLNPDVRVSEEAKFFLSIADAANKIFKPLATTVSPRTTGFTAVNTIGNFFNSSLGGMHPLSYFKILLPGNRAKLAKAGYKSGEDWLASEFGLTLTEQGFKTSLWKTAWQRTTKILSSFNQLIENSAKDALALDRLAKGDNVIQARRVVDKFLFDYSDLSPYETQVIKKIIPFYCVPDYSEILTKTGWRFRDELSIGDYVLTYDIHTREAEWQPVEDIAAFDFDGELSTLTSRLEEFAFTEDHRWPVITQKTKVKGKEYGDEAKIVRAYELNTNHKIPLVADGYSPTESILSPTEASLLGWIATDGYCRWRGKSLEAMIYQSPKKHADKIRARFKDYIGSESVHPDTGVVCFRIKTSTLANIKKYFKSKEDLPAIVTRLGVNELEAMYEAMLDAEGHRGLKGVQFVQKLGGVMDAFQIICNLLGKPFQIKVHKSNGCAYGYVRDTKTIGIKSYKRLKKHYKGKIWCPKTRNSTWVMRQNGKVVITGNTWMRKNVPMQVEQFIKQPEKYLKVMAVLHNAQLDADKQLGVSRPNQAGKAPWLMNPEIAGYELPLRSLRTPFKDEKGNQLVMKTRLPIEDLREIFDSPLKRVLSALGPVPKSLIEIAANQDVFTGDTLFLEGMDFWERMEVAAKKVASNQFPVAKQFSRTSELGTDKASATFGLMTGLRLYSLDIPEGLRIKENEYQKKLEENSKAAVSLKYKYSDGKISDEDMNRQLLEIKEKQDKILSEYEEFIKKATETVRANEEKKNTKPTAVKTVKRPVANVPSFIRR